MLAISTNIVYILASCKYSKHRPMSDSNLYTTFGLTTCTILCVRQQRARPVGHGGNTPLCNVLKNIRTIIMDTIDIGYSQYANMLHVESIGSTVSHEL